MINNVQSAYKTGHSCETALLRVLIILLLLFVNVIVQCLFYLILDLYDAFDTIDHDNLFCILEKYVGISGNALKLIKSYFSNLT